MVILNYECMDKLQTLVKAEWDIVRVGNNSNPNINITTQDTSLCGILYYKEYAFAGNGHWFGRIKLRDSYAENPYFFDYNLDDVKVAFNPFADVMHELFNEVTSWQRFSTKIRPTDFLEGVDKCLPILRERRLYNVQMEYIDGMILCTLFPKRRTDEIKYFNIPVYSTDLNFAPCTLSLTYLYKMLEIIAEYYYVVELASEDSYGAVILKAKRIRSDKPDIRFRLENYHNF